MQSLRSRERVAESRDRWKTIAISLMLAIAAAIVSQLR